MICLLPASVSTHTANKAHSIHYNKLHCFRSVVSRNKYSKGVPRDALGPHARPVHLLSPKATLLVRSEAHEEWPAPSQCTFWSHMYLSKKR